MTSPADSFLNGPLVDLTVANILVVDDKAPFRDMVRAALEQRVHALRDVASVEEAMEVLLRDGADIHCVVCDWNLLPVGGLELLRMIRCRTLPPASPRLPVVVITAKADPEAVKTAMELDVNGFVVTPASLEKLVRTVTGAMSRTWTLQGASHYASVPGIVPPPSPLPKVTLAAKPRARSSQKFALIAKPFGRRGDPAEEIRRPAKVPG
jgi:two-component system, chemotaxis family, chemotaxis protein CheY